MHFNIAPMTLVKILGLRTQSTAVSLMNNLLVVNFIGKPFKSIHVPTQLELFLSQYPY